MHPIKKNTTKFTIQSNINLVFMEIGQCKYDMAWHKNEIKKREKKLIKLKKKYNELQDLIKNQKII